MDNKERITQIKQSFNKVGEYKSFIPKTFEELERDNYENSLAVLKRSFRNDEKKLDRNFFKKDDLKQFNIEDSKFRILSADEINTCPEVNIFKNRKNTIQIYEQMKKDNHQFDMDILKEVFREYKNQLDEQKNSYLPKIFFKSCFVVSCLLILLILI